jgi:integrase/recombinase XerD
MAIKRPKPEEIVMKLRQVEALMGQGMPRIDAIRLRAKEIAALTVGDVYDEQGSVREQFVLDAVQTKGAKTRTIWINAKLRRQLELYRSSLFFKDSNRALFQSQKGGAFSANTMTQLFLNIYRAAGFENASSHSGRRTFITELASKGVSVRVLAELAGHSSIQTTQG